MEAPPNFQLDSGQTQRDGHLRLNLYLSPPLVMLVPVSPAKPPSTRDTLRHLWRLTRLIRSYWPKLVKGMVIGIVLGLLGMLAPYVSKLLIDEVYPTGSVTLMHVLVMASLALAVSQAVLGAVRSYFVLHVSSHLQQAANLYFFNHLLHLRLRFFEEQRVGEVMSRFSDVRSCLGSLTSAYETVFVSGVYLLLVPPFLFLLQPKLALVSLIAMPLTIGTTIASAKILRGYWKQSTEAYAKLGAYQFEVLSHIRTMKSLGMEHMILAQTTNASKEALRIQLKAGGLAQACGLLNATFEALSVAFFTWYAWTLIIEETLTLGAFFAFTAYMGYLHRPLRSTLNLASDFQLMAVRLERMFEYLDSEVEQSPETVYTPPSTIQHPLVGDIVLRNVGLSYTPGSPVLQSINLHIPNGRITALIGPSGAGKSTLLRLLTRLEEPDAGSIAIGGIDLALLPLRELRRQISVVPQEIALVSGSVWDNLTLGVPAPDPERVKHAVRLCRLDSLIDRLSLGFESPVGEWGTKLSGGQRQRIAIARALIRDAPILLLDEATSHLDTQTEAEILTDLFACVEGKTVIFVTHRIATAELAHHVCVLDSGRVIAAGPRETIVGTRQVQYYFRSPFQSDASVDPPKGIETSFFPDRDSVSSDVAESTAP
jgi:ABC-type bacteriocin/lantibiotic exporter with double-glycine peptidase domain